MEGYWVGYMIGVIIWGLIWGWATNKVIENKGYSENWFWWGFFFGFIAFIVALTKPDARRYDEATYKPMYGNVSNSNATLIKPKRVASGTEWECAFCHRVNQAFTGTCACGHTKSDSEERRNRIKKEQETFQSFSDTSSGFVTPLHEEFTAVSATTNELRADSEKDLTEQKKVDMIREYKKLLDEEIITREEFEAKKKELLK